MRNDEDTDVTQVDSWIKWFKTRKSAPTIDRFHKATLFQTFNASISDEECKKQLIKQNELSFLLATNFGKGSIAIIHHCNEIGGNIGTLDEFFGAIQGVQKNSTCVITPNTDTLFSIAARDQPLPKTQDIMNATTMGDIDNLVIDESNKFTGRSFIPIPPFMLEPIDRAIDASRGCSKTTLLEVINTIKDYDSNLVSIEGITLEKAEESCEYLLHWLYLVSQEKIVPTPTMGCCDETVREYYNNLEMIHLKTENRNQVTTPSPVSGELTRPLEIIANSSSVTRDYLDKLTQIQSSSGDKKSKSFTKLAKKYQHMLLVASSFGTVTCTHLNPDGLEFFSQSSSLHSQIFLNSYLEARDIDCSISSALATILMHGSFTWANAVTPSGLASSVISSKDIMNNDTLYEGIVLDYSIKHEITNESLSKLTKTKVLYPTDIEAMIQRLDALTALAELFFGDTSLIYKGLDELIYACRKNKTLLRRKLCLDDMFIPKFLYSVDDRVNQWLIQCSQSDNVEETSMELVQFSNLIVKLQLNEFSCFLPVNIKKIIKDKSKKRDSPEVKGPNSESNKNGKKAKQENVMVRNENVDQDWKLKDSENWNLTFRHKSRDAPTLANGSKACLKYHVKGFCFDDCKFRGSHHQLTGDDHEKTKTYIKSLRE